MKGKLLACFFPPGKKHKICLGDFETVLHKVYGRGAARSGPKRRKRR